MNENVPNDPKLPANAVTEGPVRQEPDRPRPEPTERAEGSYARGESSAVASTSANGANESNEPLDATTGLRETAIALRVSDRERSIIDALTKIRSDDGLIKAATVSDYVRWLIERDNSQVLEAITRARNV